MGIKKCFNETKDYFKYDDNTSLDDIKEIYQGWSYDLRLGEYSYITSDECPKKLDNMNPYLIIKPGDFALLITHESLKLDELTMAFISLKFTYKKQGLINISGFHVDPQYEGKIIFSVYNAGPSDIILKYKEAVFMIFFQTFDEIHCDPKYCENHIDKNCCYQNKKGHNDIPTSFVSEIKGESTSLAENHQKINALEKQLKMYGWVVGTVILLLLSIIISLISSLK